MERRPEPLGRLDQRDRVVPLGPLGQGARGEDRRAGLVGGLLDDAAGHDQRGGDERPSGQVDDDDRQAVRQAVRRVTAGNS